MEAENCMEVLVKLEDHLRELSQRRDVAELECQQVGPRTAEAERRLQEMMPALKALEWEWEEVSQRYEHLQEKVTRREGEAEALKLQSRALHEQLAFTQQELSLTQTQLQHAQHAMGQEQLKAIDAENKLAELTTMQDEANHTYNVSLKQLTDVNTSIERVSEELNEKQVALRLKLEDLAELESDIVSMLPQGILQDGFLTLGREVWRRQLDDAVDTQLHALQAVKQQLAELADERATLVKDAEEIETSFNTASDRLQAASARRDAKEAEVFELEQKCGETEDRIVTLQEHLARRHAEMGLAEMEEEKISLMITEATEKQHDELRRLKALSQEILKSEEEAAGAEWEAGQVKQRTRAIVTEKQRCSTELERELCKLDCTKQDLEEVVQVSVKVHRELEHTRSYLESAEKDLKVVAQDLPLQQTVSHDKSEFSKVPENEVCASNSAHSEIEEGSVKKPGASTNARKRLSSRTGFMKRAHDRYGL